MMMNILMMVVMMMIVIMIMMMMMMIYDDDNDDDDDDDDDECDDDSGKYEVGGDDFDDIAINMLLLTHTSTQNIIVMIEITKCNNANHVASSTTTTESTMAIPRVKTPNPSKHPALLPPLPCPLRDCSRAIKNHDIPSITTNLSSSDCRYSQSRPHITRCCENQPTRLLAVAAAATGTRAHTLTYYLMNHCHQNHHHYYVMSRCNHYHHHHHHQQQHHQVHQPMSHCQHSFQEAT